MRSLLRTVSALPFLLAHVLTVETLVLHGQFRWAFIAWALTLPIAFVGCWILDSAPPSTGRTTDG